VKKFKILVLNAAIVVATFSIVLQVVFFVGELYGM
jgi:hypothetical protein